MMVRDLKAHGERLIARIYGVNTFATALTDPIVLQRISLCVYEIRSS